jgi:hypothetical protein
MTLIVRTVAAHITLHCTAPHCTALHCTTLHHTALNFTKLHRTALHNQHCNYSETIMQTHTQTDFSSLTERQRDELAYIIQANYAVIYGVYRKSAAAYRNIRLALAPTRSALPLSSKTPSLVLM